MQPEIVSFDPKTGSREEWNRLHVYRRLRHEEKDPGDPLLDDDTIEEFMKAGDPQSEVLFFMALNPERPEEEIGLLTFDVFKEGAPSYEENKSIAWLGLSVLPAYRRQGLGTRLLAKGLALAKDYGKSTVLLDSDEDDGKAFLDAIGGKVAHRWRQNRLALDEVDWDMVHEWADEGPERSPDTTLVWVDAPIDESLIEEYCELFTEVFNQMPFDELELGDFSFTPETVERAISDFENAGGTWFAVTTREADGALSGITEMGYLPDRETIISQFMTGVGEPYRGRGLGKWLKAAMLLRVRDDYPQVKTVITGNATSNAPMMAINNRLGFKPHKEGVTAQMSIEDIEAYLSR